MSKRGLLWTVLLTFAIPSGLVAAAAEPVSLAGKRVEITVGYSSGGAPDTAARLVAQHLGRFFPGKPSFIVINKPGAETSIQANYMANIAPADGLSIAYFSRASALQQIANRPGVKFDMGSFRWFWGFAQQNLVAFIRRDRDLGSIEKARSAKSPIIFGARAAGSTDFLGGKALEALGVPVNIIVGYEGGQMTLAFERGEVDALAFTRDALRQRSDWLKPDGLAVLLVEFGSIPSGDGTQFGPDLAPLPGKQSVYSLINKALGLPVGAFAGPPGMSDAMLAAYRDAFARMAADPQFLADAERSHMEVGTFSGPDLAQMFREFLAAPPEAKKEFAALVQ